uniref:peptidylprolyl isomerase n=1 Tax=Electrophorus electricus TaxID=8005 RepID=A0A4W4FP47_ELEEL
NHGSECWQGAVGSNSAGTMMFVFSLSLSVLDFRAKLASLFGLDQATSQGNESFQYTAPKQPRKISINSGPPAQKPGPPSVSPAVLFATAVQAYRYVNGQYMKQGKLGAAVLGNHTTKEYKLLLYASQQRKLTAARIHPLLRTVQPSNYCTFYDDQRQNWSLMFESEKAATDFCKEVCLAKANSGAPLEAVVTQDLVSGEGQEVEHGDSLEVAYTGWLLQKHTIGQVFDSNVNKDKLLRLKLGAGKVIKGWEEGMLNMRKGGRRLMVIPPALAYGSQGVPGQVPPDSTLVFEAEVRRVRECSLSVLVQTPCPGRHPCCLWQNPDATKAKLISRMAKMGQPMLPFLAGTAAAPSSSSQAESSDSELEVYIYIKKSPPTSFFYISESTMVFLSVPFYSVPFLSVLIKIYVVKYTEYLTLAPSPLQPLGQVYPTQTVPYQGSSDVTSFLMTEARQHSTEIRLAVGKVADKVDQLACKMEDLHKQGGLSVGLSNVSMETAMIMHNIQRIIQENECLKKEVFEKSSRIEEQNRKIGELINQNQRCMEHSNLLMEQRNDSLKSSSEHNQARILQAEQEKARLTEELACSTARVSELQLELSAQRQHSSGLQTSLSGWVCVCLLVSELKDTAEQVQTQLRAEKQKRKEAELRLSSLDDELQDVKSEKENLERTLSERKRKWQMERQRFDEELEELRKASQLEMDTLRNQLRKARTSTDQAAAEQLTQVQADVEREWQAKCEQALATAREQHSRQITELTEHRDTLQLKLTQLQDRVRAHTHTRTHTVQLKHIQLQVRTHLHRLSRSTVLCVQTVQRGGRATVATATRSGGGASGP